jgi:hypothetical protein
VDFVTTLAVAKTAFEAINSAFATVGAIAKKPESLLHDLEKAKMSIAMLQDLLVSTQQGCLSLQSEFHELNKKYRELEEQTELKSLHTIHKTAGGNILYAAKALDSAGNPLYYACPQCMNSKGKLSLLQPAGGRLLCTSCQIRYPKADSDLGSR